MCGGEATVLGIGGGVVVIVVGWAGGMSSRVLSTGMSTGMSSRMASSVAPRVAVGLSAASP